MSNLSDKFQSVNPSSKHEGITKKQWDYEMKKYKVRQKIGELLIWFGVLVILLTPLVFIMATYPVPPSSMFVPVFIGLVVGLPIICLGFYIQSIK